MSRTADRFICRECHRSPAPGAPDHPSSAATGADRARMLARSACAPCDAWLGLVAIRHENRSVRALGRHYLIGPGPGAPVGRTVTIRFTDAAIRPRGRAETVVVTGDLTAQGPIPPRFLSRLPDNALVEPGDGRRRGPGASLDIDALAAAAGLRAYDTALPQEWVDRVRSVAGASPVGLGVVWCYDTARSFGAPVALTPAARALLDRYEGIVSSADC